MNLLISEDYIYCFNSNLPIINPIELFKTIFSIR